MLSRLSTTKDNKVLWQCVADRNSAVVGSSNTVSPAETDDWLRLTGLNAGEYVVQTRPSAYIGPLWRSGQPYFAGDVEPRRLLTAPGQSLLQSG